MKWEAHIVLEKDSPAKLYTHAFFLGGGGDFMFQQFLKWLEGYKTIL